LWRSGFLLARGARNAPQRKRQIVRRVKSLLGILRQAALNDPFQLGRDLRIPLANRWGRLIQESVEDNRLRRTVKRS
jgi:hypothetical protein